LSNVNGTLFFQATDSTAGAELWRSDGSAAGTTRVADINAGGAGSSPYYLTNVNGVLFFDANDGTHGVELWESNGTSAGTSLVLDIASGSTGSYPTELTNVNGALFFNAGASKTSDRELWRTTGGGGGSTMRIEDLNPGLASSNPNFLTNVNGTLFFSANSGSSNFQLWMHDSSNFGPIVEVATPNPSGNSYLFDLTNLNGTLLFSANDGSNGAELWQSTGSGATLVKDINAGSAGSYPGYLTNVNGSLFFAANDGAHGDELWMSNGTAAGTSLVKDINSGAASAYPNYLTNVNGVLFFQANDGTHGVEPWVLKYGSTTSVAPSPASSFFGQPVTYSATVASDSAVPGVPTGTVTFSVDGTPLGSGPVTLAGGIATFSTSTLSVGGHTITAMYNGDGRFSTSSGSNSSEVVSKDATTTTMLASPSTLVSGEPVAFVAIVSNSSGPFGTPTGTIQFAVDGTNLGSPVSLVMGVAGSIPTQLLAAGSPHTITATYTNIDGHFTSGSGSLNQAVSAAGTTTAVSSSPSPAVFGQIVTFTGTVSVNSPGAGVPTGTVDFKEGSTDLTPGGVALAAGRATFTTSSLTVAHHTITATYAGNASFTTSNGDDSALPEVVNQAVSRTVLTSFPDPGVFGQVVSFTVGVSVLLPGQGTPTGMVTFKDGTATFGSIMLNGVGRATFTTAALSRGNHAISANYGGDGHFLSSAYLGFGQAVQKAATTTTVTASANPAVVNTAVTLTASLAATSPGAGIATGTVTFKDITTVLATVMLNGTGQQTFSTSGLAVGTHAITATYGGDNNFTGSVSAIFAETITATGAHRAVVSSPKTLVIDRATLESLVKTRSPVATSSIANVSAPSRVADFDADRIGRLAAELSPATVDRYFALEPAPRITGTARAKGPGLNGDWLDSGEEEIRR
jgi:ELWxxDGT repeat protein